MTVKQGEAAILTRIREHKQGLQSGDSVAALVRLVDQLQSPDALERAGHILARMPWPPEALREVRIAVLSSFTCSPLLNQLRALLLRSGLRCEFYVSEGTQFLCDLMNDDSNLYKFAPTFTLCCLEERWFIKEVGPRFTLDSLAEVCRRRVDELVACLESCQSRTGSLVVVNTVPLSTRTYHAVIDYQSKARLGVMWRELNNRLLRWAAESSHVCAVDLETLLQEVEGAGLCDPRLSYYAALHLSPAVLGAYATESAKIVRAALGFAKKCLVLDLDNTLWGGIVGDVGWHGIELGPTSPGNVFVDLQEYALRLKDQGVLLAVCSKNDEAVVRDVFERHDGMRLHLDDIVACKVNWAPKAQNLQELATELNLSTDSLVLLDDNPVERDMVANFLPEVVMPKVGDHATTFLPALLNGGWFNVLQLSTEDAVRTQHYKEAQVRERLRRQAPSVEAYLQGLETRIRVRPLDDAVVGRLAQLFLRTNQFNLTGRRYQECQLRQLVQDNALMVFGFEVTDRCGSAGIVSGVVIEAVEKPEKRLWYIRSYVLSCRVFARGIEVGILRYLLALARRKGIDAVYGEYIPTPKNRQFANFYVDNGFEKVDREAHAFRYDLTTLEAPVPWLRIE